MLKERLKLLKDTEDALKGYSTCPACEGRKMRIEGGWAIALPAPVGSPCQMCRGSGKIKLEGGFVVPMAVEDTKIIKKLREKRSWLHALRLKR